MAAATSGGQNLVDSDYQAYPLKHAAAAEVESTLDELLAGLEPGVEVLVDTRGNRLLVRGSPAAQQVAQNLVRSVDQPTAATAAHQKNELRSYSSPGPAATRLVSQLQARFANQPGVRIATHDRSGQVLVLAPPAVQEQVRQALGAPPARVDAGQPTPDGQGQPVAAPASPAPIVADVTLKHLQPADLEATLGRLWGDRLSLVGDGVADVVAYHVQISDQEQFDLEIDRRGARVVVRGAGPSASRCARLIAALDRPASDTDQTGVAATKRASPALIQRAVDALRSSVGESKTSRTKLPLSLVFQQREGAAAGEQPAQPPAEGAAQPGAAVEPDGGLLGQVQIEFLEGLDAMIIRGNARDVERIMEMIEEIERVSEFTQPVIEVYNLRHVGSQAMAAIVRQIYDQVLAPRQGQVSITALVKPNALLLIGRPESVKSVTDLIARLDQPVGPSTQFEVFHLRYASAATVQQTIETFYAQQADQPAAAPPQPGGAPAAAPAPGLGARVRATADVRSNSVIVQASPRDLREVALLIRTLDTPTSESVNELRVVKLQNTLAEDLAPVLQDAITAQGGGAQAGPAQPTAPTFPGAPGAGDQGPSRTQQAPAGAKSTRLQITTIDREGRRQLESGILSDVRITPDARANTLLISAPAESMELLLTLVRELDQPPATVTQIKVFEIKNGDATALVDLLSTLFGQTTAARAGQQQGAFLPQVPVAGGSESGIVQMRFSVDPRTNSIIASGSTGDLNVVEAILFRLDESDIRQRQSKVYRLKNSYAVEVANAINEMLRSERTLLQQTGAGLVSPFEQMEREVVVVAEEVSNSLIVSTTPRYYQQIEDLVRQLDERPPMVLMQVLIAEVVLNNTDEFGVELGLQDSLLFDRSLLEILDTTTNSTSISTQQGVVTTTNEIIQSANNTPGFNFNNTLPLGNSGSTQSFARAGNVAPQGLTNFAVGRSNAELGYGGLVISASSENVSLLIRALQESRRLEILSRPQVMTLDNQEAYIQVGQSVPRVQDVTINPLGGLNASAPPTDVGIILAVIPRVSPDGVIVMQINANKSDVAPEIEGIPIAVAPTGEVFRSPRINVTTAQTVVSAVSGQTVILGGLITRSTNKIERRVPVLSQIPILGNLFRYNLEQNRRTELLIVLTPHIVRRPEDADNLRQIEASRMSWCLADVEEIHGSLGLRGREDLWTDAETPTVYPDLNPTGEALGPDLPLPVPSGEPALVPGGPSGPEMPPPGAAVPVPAAPPATPSVVQPQQFIQPAQYQSPSNMRGPPSAPRVEPLPPPQGVAAK